MIGIGGGRMARFDGIADPTVAVLREEGLSLGDVTGRVGQERGRRAVRRAIEALGLDAVRAGTARWNPLSGLVRPGGTVLVKPNWVHHRNPGAAGDAGIECLVTSPAFVLEAVRLAGRAVGPDGRIVVGDSPIQGCDLDLVLAMHNLGDDLSRGDFGAPVRIADFRRTRAILDATGYPIRQVAVPGDQDGYSVVNLDRDSRLADLDARGTRFAVSHYSSDVTSEHHGAGRHEYLLAGIALDADLVLGLPKLKTHEKSGLTCCLKNLVGLNGHKEWLPHYREGPPERGGDEVSAASLEADVRLFLERLETRLTGHPLPKQVARAARIVWRAIAGAGERRISGGAWHGNDTLWRMVMDLNRALLYARRDGTLCDRPCRRTLSIVDGLLAGEGQGPLRPTPLPAGLVLAGASSVAVDWCAAILIGLDPERLPTIRRAFDSTRWPLATFRESDVRVRGDFEGPVGCLPVARFAVPEGWIGRIEAGERQ
jgi:uncharacterized protein (DUF362 family)